MFACLHLPDFPLQAWLRREPGWRWEPVGTLDSLADCPGDRRRPPPRLTTLTPSAIQAGVEIGMTPAQGQARCGTLRAVPRDPQAEEEIRDLLLATAARITADYEATAPGLITLDLGPVPGIGSPGAAERVGHAWVAALADQELDARAGFAPNPDLAALAARLADPVRVLRGDPATLRDTLAPLPLTLADPPPDYLATLTLWGIATLGDLAALPREELPQRLGPGAETLWDRAVGHSHRPLRLVRIPADFSLLVELDHEISTLEPLMFLLRRSLDTLTARLASAYLAASEIHLELHFTDHSQRQEIIRLPDPGRDPEQLSQLLHTRLEGGTFQRPAEGYRLQLTPGRPAAHSLHLFDATLRDPHRFADTLARIEALVGSENVGSPEPLDTHRPDAFIMHPFDPTAAPPTSQAADARPRASRLPLRRYRPPRHVEITTRPHPLTGHPIPAEIRSPALTCTLDDAAGPWRMSGDWWDPDQRWRREEWDVQSADGQLYRLALCHQTTGESPTSTWYLEGIYG